MKVWIVSVLLFAAFTLQITEGAAVISPKEAPEIPQENVPDMFPEISLEEAAKISPENLPDISPVEAVEISPENVPENSPENLPDISPEEAVEISPKNVPEISPENLPDISPEEAAEIYAEEAEVAEHEQNMHEPSEKAAEMGVKEMSAEGRSVLCPPGWFRLGARCFLLVRSAYSWTNAETHCANNQATLASVHSPSEYNFLQSLLTVSGQSVAWIGAYNFLNTWRWKDNSGFYYTKWQSLSSVASYPCAYMTSTGGWINTNCANGYVFFCAMKPSTC